MVYLLAAAAVLLLLLGSAFLAVALASHALARMEEAQGAPTALPSEGRVATARSEVELGASLTPAKPR